MCAENEYQGALENGNILDVSTIPNNVGVVCIKINQFYPLCFEHGRPNQNKVKDSVRALWRINLNRIDLNDPNKQYYLFALYRTLVVGTFHITSMYRLRDVLENYPTFPVDVREVENLCRQFNSLDAARRGLPEEDFARVDTFLKNFLRDRDLDITPVNMNNAFNNIINRVYFNVDDNIPTNIKKFKGNIITRNDRPTYFRGASPILYINT